MILQFTVSNFRAFRDVQTLNFAASNYDKTLPENCIAPELPGLKGQKFLKGVALYGPNAGGKSTVINALSALASLVKNSAKTTDPQDPIDQIQPFALAPEFSELPTGFGVVFENNGVRYEYRVAATRKRVWHESLRAFPKGKEQLWFCRDWDETAQIYHWTPEKSAGYRRDVKKEEFTLQNVLYLSKAISLGDTQLESVFRWFKERLQFVDLSVNSKGLGEDFTAQQIAQNSALVPRILGLLRHADLGIVSAAAKSEKMDEQMLAVLNRLKEVFTDEGVIGIEVTGPISIELSHHAKNADAIPLPWQSESCGTQRLFELAGPWLDILEKGRVVCIDELETSMHPLMVMELLRLLFSDETNPNGAQIIFTTHNPLLLDPTLMRRDQVWFADKGDDGAAHLYPLTDYAPRQGESLVRGYLSGRYGAVPYIPAGLLGNFGKPQMAGGGDE